MNKVWSDESWEDYLYWQTQDRKTLKRINRLLQNIDRNGNEGIGKSETLRNRKIPGKKDVEAFFTDKIMYFSIGG